MILNNKVDFSSELKYLPIYFKHLTDECKKFRKFNYFNALRIFEPDGKIESLNSLTTFARELICVQNASPLF